MRLDLHAKVLTRDGEPAGNLDRAIVDPLTNEVTDFVVSTGGFFGKDVIVPHEDIDQASAEGDVLRLRLDKADLERLPTYEPVEYSGPPQGWLPPAGYGLPFAGYVWPLAPASRPEVSAAAREPWEAPRAVSIDKASSVIDRNGDEIGVVEDVRLDPASDRLEGFDVRLGGPLRTLFPGGDVIHLGIRLVDSVEPGLVRLHVAKEALETPHG